MIESEDGQKPMLDDRVPEDVPVQKTLSPFCRWLRRTFHYPRETAQAPVIQEKVAEALQEREATIELLKQRARAMGVRVPNA